MKDKELTADEVIRRAMVEANNNIGTDLVASFRNRDTGQNFYIYTEKQLNDMGVTIKRN